MDPLQALGDEIAGAWRRLDHDDAAFTALATDRLTERIATARPTLADLARWLVAAPALPSQSSRSFGQPPVNVYVGHKFHIELLVWKDSTTAIHQHSFSGAFGVLEGSSVHSRYDFECHERVCTEVLLGDVRFRSAELLRAGDVRPIEPGDGHQHALFHLDRPTLTVVVRTTSEPRYDPQYSYLKPGLAVDPFYRPQPFETQLELLEALVDVDLDLFGECGVRLIAGGDFWLTLRVLGLALRQVPGSRAAADLVAAARERHGARVEYLVAAAEEQRRQADIVARREKVRDPDQRFFLALLLNAPDRETFLELIEAREPGVDPRARIVGWLGELSAAGLIGLEFNALSLKLLEFALHDEPFDAVREALRTAFDLDAAELAQLAAVWEELHSALVLAPLFSSREPAVAA